MEGIIMKKKRPQRGGVLRPKFACARESGTITELAAATAVPSKETSPASGEDWGRICCRGAIGGLGSGVITAAIATCSRRKKNPAPLPSAGSLNSAARLMNGSNQNVADASDENHGRYGPE